MGKGRLAYFSPKCRTINPISKDMLRRLVTSRQMRALSNFWQNLGQFPTHTHTHPFNGPLSGTTQVSRYQKGTTNLDFTEARDSEWHWHQLGHMQVCTLLQTDNHASTPPQFPTASKIEG